MSVIANNIVAGAAGQGGADAAYQIDRSVRLNSADSAHFSRTPSSAGNRKTWTWSGWVKRSKSALQMIFNSDGGTSNSTFGFLAFMATDKFLFGAYTTTWRETTAVYRDYGAWYHVVVAFDTTQATASDRVRIYINGDEVTDFSTSNDPASNTDYAINQAQPHNIGKSYGSYNHFNGYLADVHFIDGQALAPTDFGEFDSNNVWQPKEPSFTSPNNGTTWSSNVSASTGSIVDAALAFNGSTSSGDAYATSTASDTYIYIDFSPSLSGAFKLWTGMSSGTPTATVTHGGGTTVVSLSSGENTLGTFTAVTRIAVNRGEAATHSFRAISVDGVVLIDGAGKYGVNGFNLDFSDNSSNAALGDDSSGNNNDWTVNNLVATVDPLYSSFATYPSSYNGSAINLFDGSTSTGWQNTDTSGSTYAEVDLTLGGTTSGIAFTTSFEMYGAFSYNQILEIDHAGGTYTYTSNPGGSGAWVNFASNLTSPVTAIRFKDSGGTGTPSWNAIRVDGSILTDGDQSAIDSLIDTPTNYEASSGNNGGNYCTWNPLHTDTSNNFNPTLSNGNLDCSWRITDWNVALGTLRVSSGKWYWEITLTAGSRCMIGVTKYNTFNSSNAFYYSSDAYAYFSSTGDKRNGGASGSSYGATFAQGDVIGVALDLDAGTLVFYKNGTSQGTAFTGLSGNFTPLWGSDLTGNTGSANFGQRPFAYTPPTGYKSLCTTNLTDPTIADGSTAMDVALYTGNSGTQTISGLGFSPDLLWIKSRSAGYSHRLFDAVRGVTKALYPDLTDTEGSAQGTNENLTAFTSDGFSLGSASGIDAINNNNVTFAGWAWDGGTTTDTSNTAGSITPTGVRANQSAGFSIVSYTGTGSAATVGHGLGVTPSMIITKRRNSASNWGVYHSSLGATQYLLLNTTDSSQTSISPWNNTAPTNTVFTVRDATFSNESSSYTYVAYCFAPVAGYSAFGSYTGNGSSDGPFVYTGFRPRWILYKGTASSNWTLHDTARGEYNIDTKRLYPHLTNAEQSTNDLDILSNGFKLRQTGSDSNSSGATYVYAAFAEHPFKTARAR